MPDQPYGLGDDAEHKRSRVNAKQREWRAAHRVEVAAQMRRYRDRHHEAMIASEVRRVDKRREYRKATSEHRRTYQAAWPWSAAYAAVKRARRSAVQWGAGPGHLTKEVFARLRLLPCTYCGSMPAGSVDHVIPFCSGGQNVMENLAPACLLCNQKKNRFDVSRVEIAG